METRSTVRVAFIDVGQGDTIVVSVPETHEAVIVDCLDAEAAIGYIEKYDIRQIRGVIISHLHLDHYRGIMKLVANVKSELNLTCEKLLFYFPQVKKEIWDRIRDDEDGHSDVSSNGNTRDRKLKDALIELRRWAQSHRDRYHTLAKDPDRILPLSGIIELIHPWEVDVHELIEKSLNDISAVLKVNGNGTSAILMGDLEPAGWDCLQKMDLQKMETDMSGDVLKFPHHGAWKDRDPEDLLKAISPTVVVISVGTDGARYNHPNPHVFEAIGNHPEICLLCTQGTGQCMGNRRPKRNDLIDCFRDRQANDDSFFVEQKGYPCAGTIVIELGQSVKILQPEPSFHREQIIKTHFPSHKCSNRTMELTAKA